MRERIKKLIRVIAIFIMAYINRFDSSNGWYSGWPAKDYDSGLVTSQKKIECTMSTMITGRS